MRQEMIHGTPRWIAFAEDIHSCVLRHQNQIQEDPLSNCFSMEADIRELCIVHFPGSKSTQQKDHTTRSLTAQMWYAKRQLRMMCLVTVKIMFYCWHNSTVFERLHK